MAEIRYNLVTFTPDDEVETSITLQLDGDFTRSTGVKPDVTRAKVPYYEMARLGGNPLRRGTLKFWYSSSPLGGKATGTPDVAYTGMRIVEVQPYGVGVVRKGPPVPIVAEWLLFIADERERLTPPRGGRLTLGILNPALADETADNGDDDAATPPAPGASAVPPSHRTARELVKECLAAAGTTLYEIIWPNPQPAAPTDLKWLGCYATVELEKLLEYTHSVYCPQSGGAVLINRVGEGPLPDVPLSRRVVDQFLPPTDRRGEVVIFSSAPVPAVETRIIEGPSPTTWEFVIQDKAGKWREVNDAQLRTDRLVHDGGPEKTVKEKYAKVDVLYQGRVRSQLYHYIRLAKAFFDPKVVGPVQSQILRRRLSTAGKLNDIEVLATIAQPDYVNGGWKNAKEPARCTAGFLNGPQNIIYVQELLGKLKDTNPVADFEANFVALAGAAAAGATTPARSADLRVKLSIEQSVEVKDKNANPDDAKRRKPAFYTVGFRRGLDAGAIVQLTDGELTSEIDSPSEDTVFISRPELRLVADFTAGGDSKPPVHNQDDLDKKAKVLAARYLKERRADRAPRTMHVKGFFRAELNGRISEVRISQSPPMTTIKVDSVWTPLGAGDITALIGSGGGKGGAGGGGGAGVGAEPYPHQGQTLNEALGLGHAGATQPMVPIAPAAPPPGGESLFVARISSSSQVPDPGGGAWPYQWTYSFQEQEKKKADYGGWGAKAGGREGAALNLIENMNTASGLLGSGGSTDNLVGTGLKPQPCPAGALVLMRSVPVPGIAANPDANPPVKEVPPKTEYWFQYENAVDGPCEPPA
jgi:hypothetical protein